MSWFDYWDIITDQRDVETFFQGVVYVLGRVIPFGILALCIEGWRRLRRNG